MSLEMMICIDRYALNLRFWKVWILSYIPQYMKTGIALSHVKGYGSEKQLFQSYNMGRCDNLTLFTVVSILPNLALFY